MNPKPRELTDEEKAVLFIMVYDGRPIPGFGESEASTGNRQRSVLAALCFASDKDRADDALQRLKYLNLATNEHKDCTCPQCGKTKTRKPEIHFRTKDHPQANGREALLGERAFPLHFPLEDGSELVVHMGQKGFDSITQLLFDMLSGALV